ncbi:phenylalanine--tRNA ligase subunit alpha [Marinivivus vitaminiproducens]|uniref:phenylalanine--tRNA ligase subunit alpha n=1 Tax=Marinivivus vitaminiproducens TaxID=3035935 RepID=UPI0027A1171E|nr:phenylalanine--tRNA ligase subunit alpha [Geminicoccaceae bacterium SCSIO 64248]
MDQDLAALEAALAQDIANAADPAALDGVRVAALGKKGRVTELVKSLGTLPPEERREAGAAFNALKERVTEALAARRSALEAAALDARLAAERIDVTLPARPEPSGRIHPVSQVTEEIVAIFSDMGFSVAEGPDVEDDFHNFGALNIPPEHPARQMLDTFYLATAGKDAQPLVLRTHTSPVQIRTMQAGPPPYRIIAPGRTYRCDYDATHAPMFHQVEGLVIDRHTHMGHLKGCLIDFIHAFFEREDIKVRFRPSFFPFTEPSAEVDIGCDRSGGELRIGEGDDWLEILGSGMVHPNVLRAVGLDPEEWQGFAFGMGIDRVTMLKYGIPDLRTFFDADLRWLQHYGFPAQDVPSTAGGLSR